MDVVRSAGRCDASVSESRCVAFADLTKVELVENWILETTRTRTFFFLFDV